MKRHPTMLAVFGLAAGLMALSAPSIAQTVHEAPARLAFNPGETLTFSVSYGVVPAGTMSMQVAELGEYEGRPAYRFVSEIESNRAISVVYEIEAREEAWFDARQLYSLKYKRRSIENDKSRDRDYVFDQDRNLRVTPDGESKATSPRAVDQLSMMYFLRLLPMESGTKFTLRNLADPKDNPLGVRVVKKERVKVPAGSFDTYLVELDLQTDSGVFKKGGQNRIWVTADGRHLPVKLTSRIGLGTFSAELVEYAAGEALASAKR